jgi:hypothetical protein
MFLATTFLALALVSGDVTAAPARPRTARIEPAPPCTAPTRTGIFRIIAMKPDSTGTRQGMIMLENVDGCLEATLITDESSPAIIDHLQFAGDTLTGTLRTPGGTARIALSFDATGVAGSITAGRQSWIVRGRRTA